MSFYYLVYIFLWECIIIFGMFYAKQRDHHNAFIWYFFKPVSVVSVGSFTPLMCI